MKYFLTVFCYNDYLELYEHLVQKYNYCNGRGKP